ncbi:MAG: phage tail family protein [Berryella intestinalis]|uniref:distal tail protein Dit n=1 Tax=Berryella intestinalis TaxID=1531429 RepID=UPI002A50C433|nr:distal tail protein Dit [Berryella intestinalis]MDD7369265.1 phage tail family protein [Berryella intestinalis]MDY3129511.1 phage tail family protein [Berryella intestinalis]
MRMNYSRIGCTGIIFDGVNLSDAFQVVDVSIPLLPTFSAVTHELAQRPGSYFASRKVGTREIKVKLRLDAESRDPMEVFKAWREVSAVFSKPEPRKLQLDEERYCYAMMVGESEIVEEAYYGVVEFTFMCFDPYFYGDEREIALSDGGTATFDVQGSVEAYPVLDLTATAASVLVTNAATGDYVRVPNTAPGSKVAIDMDRQAATIGGEYAPVDLLSDFFPVDGAAKVKLDGARGTLRYRERFI